MSLLFPNCRHLGFAVLYFDRKQWNKKVKTDKETKDYVERILKILHDFSRTSIF